MCISYLIKLPEKRGPAALGGIESSAACLYEALPQVYISLSIGEQWGQSVIVVVPKELIGVIHVGINSHRNCSMSCWIP